jgi:hypothetical protein
VAVSQSDWFSSISYVRRAVSMVVIILNTPDRTFLPVEPAVRTVRAVGRESNRKNNDKVMKFEGPPRCR